MLLYVGAQALLLLLWPWNWKSLKRDPTRVENCHKRMTPIIVLGRIIWYTLFGFGIVLSVITSVGGTSKYLLFSEPSMPLTSNIKHLS